jgi:hypothetical protein
MPQSPVPTATRGARRRDEIAGFWPGVQLAVGLATLTGLVTVVVLIAWLRVAGSTGLFSEESGLLATAGWWALLWLVLSGGLLAGLWGGYRAWAALYPLAGRYRAARAAVREEREAVRAAEALLDATRTAPER